MPTELEIIDHGTAVQGEQRWRLKDLLAPDELAARALRLTSARLEERFVKLEFEDAPPVAVVRPDRDLEAARSEPPLLVVNIGQLVTGGDHGPDAAGERLECIVDAAVCCRDGWIEQMWGSGEQPPAELRERARVVDARGGLVTPGLVDPHTHPVFAGERSVEFGLKARGASYMEIHRAGGGILSTVSATREAPFEQLVAVCRSNLDRLLSWGVTSCEGKSGYALTVDGELRMLEALRVAANAHPVDVVPTLLGAHTLPPEHRDTRAEYVAEVTEQMIPRAVTAGLARYCDAYCEDGAFSPAEVETIFTAARDAGLGLRLHAEQFSDQGGAALAARMGAASADHLEAISAAGIEAMASAGTTAILLPGAALTCRCPWPPARAICEAGVPLALGTDLNPGSSMTSSLPLMMSLACMQMQVSCEQAWLAVTAVAAHSLDLDAGQIMPGAPADLLVFDAPDYRYIPYHYGDNHLRIALKGGRVVRGRQPTGPERFG